MQKKINKFYKEHARGILYLNFLGDALNRMQLNGYNFYDAKLSSDVSKSLNELLKEHCSDEEKNLFPGIKNKIKLNVKEFYSDHSKIKNEADLLRSIIEKLNSTGESLNSAIAKTRALRNLIEDHFNKENELMNSISEPVLQK